MLQRGCKAAMKCGGEKKKILASYCTRSVVALWSWETQIQTVCHCIHSYLLWYSIMVSVGHSVRSYVCTDLLSIHEGSLSKGGFHGTHGTPSRSPSTVLLPVDPWILYIYIWNLLWFWTKFTLPFSPWFEHGEMLKIHHRIMLDFYLEPPDTCNPTNKRQNWKRCVCLPALPDVLPSPVQNKIRLAICYNHLTQPKFKRKVKKELRSTT